MVDNYIKEFDNIAQEFLRDALARRIDRQLDTRGRKQNPSRKHRHTDGLSKASGGADQHLLRQMLPAVDLQYLLMIPRKLARFFGFPESARAGFL